MAEVLIREKDDSISFEAIQELLGAAHKSNIEKGLVYATANQTPEKLKSKIGEGGVCFVALVEGALAGTITVSFRKLEYWYHSGDVAIVKLLGVNPEFKGLGIAPRLVSKCIETAQDRGVKVLVSDSAEDNVIVRNILHKQGFLTVDYCKYAANNFYSNVYAKWINGCPYGDFYRKLRYRLKRFKTRRKYKPDTGRK